jgi:hypothetical protein
VIIGCAVLVAALVIIMVWLLIALRKRNKAIVTSVEKLDD